MNSALQQLILLLLVLPCDQPVLPAFLGYQAVLQQAKLDGMPELLTLASAAVAQPNSFRIHRSEWARKPRSGNLYQQMMSDLWGDDEVRPKPAAWPMPVHGLLVGRHVCWA